jgi:hypothetical protein
MIEIFSTEFWIAILFFINFFLVLFLFVLVKKINRMNLEGPTEIIQDDESEDTGQASDSAMNIINMLEPLVKESRNAAISFDEQIKEKRRLLKGLNDALDSRIISINLLLSRADALQRKMEEKQTLAKQSFSMPINTGVPSAPGVSFATTGALDNQNQILEMYNQDHDIDSIASKLSIPKGEVKLVVDLKKKFIAMEQDS